MNLNFEIGIGRLRFGFKESEVRNILENPDEVKNDKNFENRIIWVFNKENTWKNFDFMAMKDRVAINFEDKKLIFKGSKYNVSIQNISSISFGKQGRDFVNNWIKIEYKSENGEAKTAFFAAGRMMGWSGIFGGTRRLLKKIENLVA